MSKAITFIQDSVPSLKAGEYTLKVNQKISTGGSQKEYSASRTFAVRGERFRLHPNEVHAIFPPDKEAGEYGSCFPHIIFNRAMLPWLRSLGTDTKQDTTWLALLLFDGDEAPSLQTRQVQDLVPYGRKIKVYGSSVTGTGQLPNGYLSYPFNAPQSWEDYTLDYGEKPSDQLQTIDVPGYLFNQIAPSEQDLEYLAHVREVDITGKPTGTGTGGKGSSLDVGTFSLIIGNRIPKLKEKSVVYLVSLEGMAKFLPGGSNAGDLDGSHIRLVSLKRWTFNALSDGNALEVALENLNTKTVDGHETSNLRLPGRIPSNSNVVKSLKDLRNGEGSGASASALVKNALGLGYTAMAHQTRAGSKTVSWYRGPLSPALVPTVETPLAIHADALNRYNPLTGLFDVSYTTAWQLGQLLALRDKHFATLQYNWKKQYRQQFSQKNSLVENLSTLLEGGGSAGPAQTLAQLFHHKLTLEEQEGPDEQLEAIVNWLLKLRKLYGVPLNYIVPDERMLPPESLRFFHYDQNWIGALIDGALSIERIPVDLKPEQTILEALQAKGEVNPNWSGFLLRSGTVIGWPGIVIECLDQSGTELKKVRWEKLSDNLLIAILDGQVDKVIFHEPQEALHFGVEAHSQITLRGLNGSQPGQEIPGQMGNVTFHSDQRTLKVATSAGQIQSCLQDLSEASANFTSAEFAVEMIKGATRVVFQHQSS